MFLGSDEVAAVCLDAIARRRDVGVVVTQPRRRRGRGGRETPTPVAEAAVRLGLGVVETADVNAPESVAAITAAAPRLYVVVAFGQILRRAVRDSALLGGVNLHFSLLPRWRGAAPVQRAILAGDAESGVCVQRVVAKLDAGPVLASVRTPVGARETTTSLMRRLTEIGAPLLADVVDRLLTGVPHAETAQDEGALTYASKIAREEGEIDFAVEDAAELDRRIRAFGESPGCRATLARGGAAPVPILVRAAEPQLGAESTPGEVLAASADGIVVAARSGALRITRLQRVGGDEVDARAFLNGFPVRRGDRVERSVRPPL